MDLEKIIKETLEQEIPLLKIEETKKKENKKNPFKNTNSKKLFRETTDEEYEKMLIETPYVYTFGLERYKKQKQKQLYEALITSYPIETIGKKIKDSNIVYNNKLGYSILSNGETVISLQALSKNINKIGELCKFYGYFISDCDNTSEESGIDGLYSITICAKFDRDVTDIVKNQTKYHATNLINWERIKKNGLTPKDGCKFDNHPERVYFTYNPETFTTLLEDNRFIGDNRYFAILSVVPSQSTNYRFFVDPKCENAFYTLETISPHVIKLIEIYDAEIGDYIGLENLDNIKNNKMKNENITDLIKRTIIENAPTYITEGLIKENTDKMVIEQMVQETINQEIPLLRLKEIDKKKNNPFEEMGHIITQFKLGKQLNNKENRVENIIKETLIKNMSNEMSEMLLNEVSKNTMLPLKTIKTLKNHKHSLGEHPSFPPDEDTTFEYKLIKNYIDNNFNDIGTLNINELKTNLSKLLSRCQKLEGPNKESLQISCVKGVCNKFGLNVLGDFVVELVDNINFVSEPLSTQNDIELDSINDLNELTKEVYKRRLINAINEGIANQYTIDILKDKLSNIYELEPELIGLYYNINKINNLLTFVDDNINNETLGAISEVEINDEIKINVKAINYLALTNELINALMNKLSLLGLPKDINKIKYITSKADVPNLIWDVRLGIPLWGIICELQGNNNIQPYIKLIQLPPDEFFDITKEIFAKTKKGKDYLKKLDSDLKYSKEYKLFNDRLNKKREEHLLLDNSDDYFSEDELYDKKFVDLPNGTYYGMMKGHQIEIEHNGITKSYYSETGFRNTNPIRTKALVVNNKINRVQIEK